MCMSRAGDSSTKSGTFLGIDAGLGTENESTVTP